MLGEIDFSVEGYFNTGKAEGCDWEELEVVGVGFLIEGRKDVDFGYLFFVEELFKHDHGYDDLSFALSHVELWNWVFTFHKIDEGFILGFPYFDFHLGLKTKPMIPTLYLISGTLALSSQGNLIDGVCTDNIDQPLTAIFLNAVNHPHFY